MLPLYPPYAINDLAHEHLAGRRPDKRSRHDPDRFFEESALHPDPIYMGFRNAVIHSPIGQWMRWIDRWAEKREDRVLGSRAGEAVHPTALPAPEVLNPALGEDRPERKTAA